MATDQATRRNLGCSLRYALPGMCFRAAHQHPGPLPYCAVQRNDTDVPSDKACSRQFHRKVSLYILLVIPLIPVPMHSLVSAYDILLMYGQIPTVGLLDNMVYDIIPQVPGAIGNVTVNASVYEVQCVAIPATWRTLFEFDTSININPGYVVYPNATYASLTLPCMS